MSQYIKKMINLDHQLQDTFIHQQVEEIINIIKHIEQHQIIVKAPIKLGIEPDKFEEITAEHDNIDYTSKLKVMNKLLNSFRQYLSIRYGIWSLPNLKTAQLIKDKWHVHTALEIMAGNAYWAKALSKTGIDVVASDNLEWAKTSSTGQKQFMPVENLSAVEAIEKYQNIDLILCSWSPNFGDQDIKVIKKWHQICQNRLIFIGEKNGATNSVAFWQSVKFKKSKELNTINSSFTSFDFIDEKIFEIGKYELEKN